MKRNAKNTAVGRWCMPLAAALLLCGCKALDLTLADFPETVATVATCSANQAGDFSFTLSDGDGRLSPPAGRAIPVSGAPFRTQAMFTPNQTGRSRAGEIQCAHSKDGPGRPSAKAFKVRDRVAPTIAAFAPPGKARVGQAFNVAVNITDDPTGPGLGGPSGLDEIQVNTTGPLSGPGTIQLAGVPPGPPDAAQGPLNYVNPISFTCTREGEGTIRLFVLDAARNQTFSPIHNVVCVR